MFFSCGSNFFLPNCVSLQTMYLTIFLGMPEGPMRIVPVVSRFYVKFC